MSGHPGSFTRCRRILKRIGGQYNARIELIVAEPASRLTYCRTCDHNYKMPCMYYF